MRAQNELSAYFAEIDRRTDNALRGIRQVRQAPKFKALPRQPRPGFAATGLLVVLTMFIVMIMD